MTVKEFKQSYFSFNGRLNRKPFLMRLMMLGALSIFFVLIVINAEPHLKEDPAHFAENVHSADYRQRFAGCAPPARYEPERLVDAGRHRRDVEQR